MIIFDKDLNLKTYNCSRNSKDYQQLDKPLINLYIQITPICNAKCYFCDTRCKSNSFDIKKLETIIKELEEKINIGKIAITGGEPLLVVDRIKEITNIAQNHYLTLNTNGFDIERLKEVYSLVKEVHLSKHHYNNIINDEIMKVKTPSLEILANNNLIDKTKINCVWQKGYIESKEDLIKMLEYIAYYGIKELRNISLLPLTKEGIEHYIDLSKIMIECESFINDGYLYDKDMCKCFEFVYLAQNGQVVKSIIRQTFNDDYSCVKQFVYDGEYLYDGFKKQNIIY